MSIFISHTGHPRGCLMHTMGYGTCHNTCTY
jgi:hypothetical protein